MDYIKSDKNKSKFKFKKPNYSFDKKEIGLVAVLLMLILIAAIYAIYLDNKKDNAANKINNFEQCAAAGNPIMESYPERCIAGDQMFVKQY